MNMRSVQINLVPVADTRGRPAEYTVRMNRNISNRHRPSKVSSFTSRVRHTGTPDNPVTPVEMVPVVWPCPDSGSTGRYRHEGKADVTPRKLKYSPVQRTSPETPEVKTSSSGEVILKVPIQRRVLGVDESNATPEVKTSSSGEVVLKVPIQKHVPAADKSNVAPEVKTSSSGELFMKVPIQKRVSGLNESNATPEMKKSSSGEVLLKVPLRPRVSGVSDSHLTPGKAIAGHKSASEKCKSIQIITPGNPAQCDVTLGKPKQGEGTPLRLKQSEVTSGKPTVQIQGTAISQDIVYPTVLFHPTVTHATERDTGKTRVTPDKPMSVQQLVHLPVAIAKTVTEPEVRSTNSNEGSQLLQSKYTKPGQVCIPFAAGTELKISSLNSDVPVTTEVSAGGVDKVRCAVDTPGCDGIPFTSDTEQKASNVYSTPVENKVFANFEVDSVTKEYAKSLSSESADAKSETGIWIKNRIGELKILDLNPSPSLGIKKRDKTAVDIKENIRPVHKQLQICGFYNNSAHLKDTGTGVVKDTIGGSKVHVGTTFVGEELDVTGVPADDSPDTTVVQYTEKCAECSQDVCTCNRTFGRTDVSLSTLTKLAISDLNCTAITEDTSNTGCAEGDNHVHVGTLRKVDTPRGLGAVASAPTSRGAAPTHCDWGSMELTCSQTVTAELGDDFPVSEDTYRSTVEKVIEGRRRFSGQCETSSRLSQLPTYVSTHSLYGRNNRYIASPVIHSSYVPPSQLTYTSRLDDSMSRYSASSYDRPSRTYQSAHRTKAADASSPRSYDSPSRKYDVTGTRSYDTSSKLSQPRSGQSSRSSSVSSTISESSNRDTRSSISSHSTIPSATQSHGSVGTSSRFQSQYASSQARRGLRSTSGEDSARQTRRERDEKSKSDVSSATSTETERRRFGYGSSRPISHPSRETQNGKAESSHVDSVAKPSALDLVAEKFGGIGARRSLREKSDEDRSRFGSAVTRRSARNVSGEVFEKTKSETKDLSSSKLSAPLRRTQKTSITEPSDSPVQLRGREIKKIENIQVASRIESLKKSSQPDSGKDRFGSGQLRRSLRENENSAPVVTDNTKTDRSKRNDRSGIASQWQAKTQSLDQPADVAADQRKSYRGIGSTSVDEPPAKKDEKPKENLGSSVLRRRIQKYSGESKSSGAVEEILAAGRAQLNEPPPIRHALETSEDVPVQKSDTKVLPSQKSLERTSKTPADDFLRRAELRSSLRQHSRDIAASAEQTLSGDVFKRSSLRSTLPLRKEPDGGNLDQSDMQRSSRTMDVSPIDVPSKAEPDLPSVLVPPAGVVVDAGESFVQPAVPVAEETEVEQKKPVIRAKVAADAEGTDVFGRPTWRKALRGRSSRPTSESLDTETAPTTVDSSEVFVDLKVTEKLVEDPQSHSTPIRSRIPKRSDSDSLAPDCPKSAAKTAEVPLMKVTTQVTSEPVVSDQTRASGKSRLMPETKMDPAQSVGKQTPVATPVATPGSAAIDMSLGDSISATPTESREDRIRRYKAERRKQLASRFQESPISKHFIKKDEPKEEKSKDGLLSQSATPQKLGETKMVLNFDAQQETVPQLKPTLDESVFKRPRAEEPEDGVIGSASKRPKSDEEEVPLVSRDNQKQRSQTSTAGSKAKGYITSRRAMELSSRSDGRFSRSHRPDPVHIVTGMPLESTQVGKPVEYSEPARTSEESIETNPLVELKITESPLQNDDVFLPSELSPQPQLATLRFTMKDETLVMPDNVARELESEKDAVAESAPVAEGTVFKESGLSSKASEKTTVHVERKVAEVKPFRQEPAKVSQGNVSIPSQPLKPTLTGAIVTTTEGKKAPFEPLIISKPEVIIARSGMEVNAAKTGLEQTMQVTSKVAETAAATAKSDISRENTKPIPTQVVNEVVTTKTTDPNVTEIKTTTTAQKVVGDVSTDIRKAVEGKKETKSKFEPHTQKVSQETTKSIPSFKKSIVGSEKEKDAQKDFAEEKEIKAKNTVESRSQKLSQVTTKQVSSQNTSLAASEKKIEIEKDDRENKETRISVVSDTQKFIQESPKLVSPQTKTVASSNKDMDTHKAVPEKTELKSKTEPLSEKLSGVPTQTIHVDSPKTETNLNNGQVNVKSETVTENIPVCIVKQKMAHEVTEASLEKETVDSKDRPISSVTVEKSFQEKTQKAVEEKKEITSQQGKILVQSVKQPVISQTEVVSKSSQKTPVKVQEEVKSDLITPVKSLQQQQQTATTTPESPDNLDELLRRNQRYLEEEVKKKLIRQQQVVTSSSSEAERAADGSLMPPGGKKKKRISPLMRRRIKDRSKSRERAEAENEEGKVEKEISAAELLASPEQPAQGEATVDTTIAKLPPFMDVLDGSRKPTDSDSTLTSVADSMSVSVTGSEDHTKRKRKDKSSVRKSQLNVSESLDTGTETPTQPASVGDLDTEATPKGQRLPDRTKTTPVTPEEVQQATEQIAERQREEVKGSTIVEGKFPKNSHTSAKGFGVDSYVKREFRLIPELTSRVSSALSKFEASENTTKTETKPKTEDLSKSGKRFARGRDFSSLIQKFSSSDSTEEAERKSRSKVLSRKLDLKSSFPRTGTTSSDESNTEAERPRRTPERTGSLKERARQFEGGAAPKVAQRSSSFKSESSYKSDFMRRMQQQQQESGKSSTQLATAQRQVNDKVSSNGDPVKKAVTSTTASTIDVLEAKISSKKEDTKVEEVIQDQQLIDVLNSRRKLSDAEFHDAFDDLSKLENGKRKSSESSIKDVIADDEVAKVLEARRKNTDSNLVDNDKDDVFQDTVETLSSTHTCTNGTNKDKVENKTEKSENSTSVKSSKQTTSENGKTVETKVESKTVVESTLKSETVESRTEIKHIAETTQKEIRKPSESNGKISNSTNKETVEQEEKKPINSTTKQNGSTEERTKPYAAPGSVMKQNSLDKPVRGILKRTSSSDYASRSFDSGPIVDPQLAAILQGRKKAMDNQEDDELGKTEEDKRDVIRQEIAGTEIHKGTEEEEQRPLSIAERIFVMENRIEEAKSCPVTPRTRSGFTTPRSRARSGTSSPSRDSLESLDDDNVPKTNPLLASDKQLMDKLQKMAEKEEKAEKRPRQPRRSRDSWRTRTLPVTLEEIQEADSLESVSSFRGLVRRKATINIFEKLQEQDKRSISYKKTEYPQPFRKDKKSRRSGRFKTAPITAAELGSIPEGNTILDPLRHLYEPLSAATSKADSGILSGSDAEPESVQSDSLKSLELDLPEDDPTRLSVSARTSIFKQLEEQAKLPEKEKPKNRSIGAKRMIEKKKRERSQTQPITEDEVKTASKIADSDKKKSDSEKTSESKSVSKEGSSDSEDELSSLSLAERVKLFDQKSQEDKAAEPPARPSAPVLRKRNRKQASRFKTQPITTEEVEKASKISPLALSMAKPPDNELLRSLPIAAQIEMMAQFAEANLSQPSSRAGSRAGSQPSSRRSSVGAESVESDDKGILKPSENKEAQEVKSILKHDGRKSSDSEIRGILKDGSKDSSEPKGILKHGDSEGEITSPAKTPEEPSRGILKHADSNDSQRSQRSALRRDPKGKSEGDLPRSILKRDSLEENKVEPDKGVLKKSRSQDFKESSEIRSILKKSSSSEVKSASCEVRSDDSDITAEFTAALNDAGDLDDSSLHDSQINGAEASIQVTVDIQERSETSETRKTSKIKNEAVARQRSRAARKTETERYRTQPADTGASEKTPEQRKMKYGASRHHTQPITPEEKEAAEAHGSAELTNRNSGSIAERLNLLKKSGEEDWKRRIRPELGLPEDVQMRVKKAPLLDRPNSIADRLNQLGESQQRWTNRVEETDVKAFTVEGKQTVGTVLDSPVSTRKRRLPKRELSFGKGDSAPSEEASPIQSPSRERIPIPKELISEGPPIVHVATSKSSSSSKTVVTKYGDDVDKEVEESFSTITVELPDIGEESFNTFFTKVDGVEEEKVDVTLDDFDQLFLQAEDVLAPTRRIRPKRRHIAQNRNPLKTRSVEIQQEYTEFRTGVAEMELKRIKREGFARDSSTAQVMLAEAAVKGLQSTESFNIELRKTKDSKVQTPGGPDKYLPYKDVMLLHIKGRRRTQTRLVAPCSASVNSGDSYILVTPDRVVNWNGKFSNVIEKAKAADIAQFVSQRKDLGYRASSPAIIVEDQKMKHVANKNFWSALEGNAESQECGPPDEDEDYEAFIVETNMVYKVCSNTLVPDEEYWGKIPRVEMLKPSEVLVFDFGSELYVWHGHQVSMEQRKMGMKLASQLWEKGYDYSMCPVNPISPLRDEDEGGPPKKSSKRPPWALFGKVNQNMETTLFKEKFFDWPESSRFAMRSKTPESFALKQVECNDLKPYDAKLLIPINTKPVTMVFEGSHVGRGDKWVEDMDGLRREFDILTLDVIVWHVLEYDHSKLPKQSYGQFHDGDTYVVRWQYMITAAGLKTLKGHDARHSLTGRERCAYFFWQGHNSTVNEKGASALMTVELDEERGPQVRVSQGKEPPCFLNLFDGGMIVHIGKREEADTNTQGAYRLYLVRNELENEMCLMEVPVATESLRSRTSLLLLNIKTGFLYIWHGAKSPSYTRKLAVRSANKLKEKCPLEVGIHSKASIMITELEEGSEKSEFWSALRSKDRKLYNSLLKYRSAHTQTPRLFYMNSVAGVFEAAEVMNPTRSHDLYTPMPFLQSDLYIVSQPALFLLDVGEVVYLWQGWWPEGDEDSENVHTGSAQARFNTDRRCAMETTIQYCREKHPSKPVKAYLVFAGLEPLAFTNLFPSWCVDEEAQQSNIGEGRQSGEVTSVEEVLARLTQSQYTLAELQERPLPEGVDPLKLETYLPEEEFEEVLKMSKEDFYALPAWKQTKLKQRVGLF